MKKIIVPTDFSKTAANAFAFAKALASSMDMPLKLVHITHPGGVNDLGISGDVVDLKAKKEKELSTFAHQFDKIGDSEMGTTTITFEQEVIIGFPSETLVDLSKEEACEFIIMGTSGANGVLQKIFGSVSIDVAQKAHCPVWLIPSNVTYEGVEHILYTGNYESSNTEMLNAIIHISDVFDAIVHLLHVNLSTRGEKAQDYENMLLGESYKEKLGGRFPLDLEVIDSDYFWKGVNRYVEEKRIGLIVMVTRYRGFLETLMHKSMTKTMILHAKAPLLILHVNKEK